MRTFALVSLLFACAAPKQEARKEPTPPPPAVITPAPVIEENVAVEYRPQSEGKTLIEIAGPAGARVDVREGQALAGRDVAPMTVNAEGDHWYMVAARLPTGDARETKVQARAGQIASVRFATP